MSYCSTRDPQLQCSFSQALRAGLAPDGGLFVPQRWPVLPPSSWPANPTLAQAATLLTQEFAAGDTLAPHAADIAAEAFAFPAPLTDLTDDGSLAVLELFHGPTAAFKDFGARFLAACLQRLPQTAGRTLNILVATSGDTGGAVAAAFHHRPGVTVTVLFPEGQVSPTQQQQLTCWGDNVQSFAVRGSFDDCQRLVKSAFVDASLAQQFQLSSANSINLGRLLPQAVYYATTSLAILRRSGQSASFIIPSGNLGNAVACVWARRMGLPIADIVLAHNSNHGVVDLLRTGAWQPQVSVRTLASAMDVGNPSNLERLRTLFPQIDALRDAVSAFTIDDAAIEKRIREDYRRYGRVWCPHTATAAEAYQRLPSEQRRRGPWVIVATAHPAKFREIVEPLIGREVAAPESLQNLFARPSRYRTLDGTLESLRQALSS